MRPLAAGPNGHNNIGDYFASKTDFCLGFPKLIGEGAVKSVYKHHSANLVLCIAQTPQHVDSVNREHAKFVALQATGLGIAAVSPIFDAPTKEDVEAGGTPLALNGRGFLEAFINGIHAKPTQGVTSAPLDRAPTKGYNVNLQSLARIEGSSAVIKAAKRYNVWVNPTHLQNLANDIVAIVNSYDNGDLTLVDLQGFVLADGHFIISDPPVGDPGNAANPGNKAKLQNLIIALLHQRNKILHPPIRR